LPTLKSKNVKSVPILLPGLSMKGRFGYNQMDAAGWRRNVIRIIDSVVDTDIVRHTIE